MLARAAGGGELDTWLWVLGRRVCTARDARQARVGGEWFPCVRRPALLCSGVLDGEQKAGFWIDLDC
jgi:hypothetical protein